MIRVQLGFTFTFFTCLFYVPECFCGFSRTRYNPRLKLPSLFGLAFKQVFAHVTQPVGRWFKPPQCECSERRCCYDKPCHFRPGIKTLFCFTERGHLNRCAILHAFKLHLQENGFHGLYRASRKSRRGNCGRRKSWHCTAVVATNVQLRLPLAFWVQRKIWEPGG